jgi:nucleolar protein 56
MHYIYSNVLGTFIFDTSFSLVAEKRIKTMKEYEKQKDTEKTFIKKFKDAKKPSLAQLKQILPFFKEQEFRKIFHSQNIIITKKDIKNSVNTDTTIFQTITSIQEIDRTSNMLSKKLRDWYNNYLPELDKDVGDHEKYAQLVSTKSRKELLKELTHFGETMGAEISSKDEKEIQELAKRVVELFKVRLDYEEYLGNIMRKYCPNITDLAGVMIAAKLLEHARTLRHLAMLPSSTIQLYGAEKALFRHIKTGSPSPKHGVIITHPYVSGVKRRDKGKAARLLAGKISIAARVDFFKGEYIADKLKKEIEKKLDIKK